MIRPQISPGNKVKNVLDTDAPRGSPSLTDLPVSACLRWRFKGQAAGGIRCLHGKGSPAHLMIAQGSGAAGTAVMKLKSLSWISAIP